MNSVRAFFVQLHLDPIRGVFKPNFLLSWPTKQEIWFEGTPEDGAETCRVNFKKLKTICSVSKRYIVNSFKF
jgi:hypothetical protein